MATLARLEEVVPSAAHSFEPEFTGPAPRPIPDRLLEGPHACSRRAAAVGAALSGLACLVLDGVPGVHVLARYLLPLGYLRWIGEGLLALSALAYGLYALRTGPFRYVRDGVPIAARVLGLVKAATALHNGIPTAHAFVASILFRHPDTGATIRTQVKSNDFASSSKARYDTPFKVGDTVTGVYFPRSLEKTLRLYAFLDLSPDLNIRSRQAPAREPAWKVALLVAAIPAMFIVLFANLYAYGRYHPLKFDTPQAAIPCAAGALLLGGGVVAFLYLSHRAAQSDIAKRARLAAAAGRPIEVGMPFLGGGVRGWLLRAIVAAGALLLGGLTAMSWCFMANAWLDRSPATTVPARVVGMTMTTHNFLFREYELEYTIAGSSEKLKMLTTPEHLIGLRGRRTVARLRAGGLGWPWVETVTPAGD